MARLKKMFKTMLASWIRASAAIIAPTQGFNVWDARGIHGALVGCAMALIAPGIVFALGTADYLDEG